MLTVQVQDKVLQLDNPAAIKPPKARKGRWSETNQGGPGRAKAKELSSIPADQQR